MQHPATRFIVDAHLDMAYNALIWKRNYRRAARWTREHEADTPAAKHNGECLVGLPDLIRGRVGLIFGTIFTQPKKRNMGPYEEVYEDAQQAHAQGMAQFDYYRRWAERDPEHIKLVTNQATLREVCAAWGVERGAWSEGDSSPLNASRSTTSASRSAPHAPRLHHPIGIVPLMENADPILEPKQLEQWYEKGLRIVGPAWDNSRYAGGTWSGSGVGLTSMGRELLEVMAEFNVILDVSHLSHQSLLEALDVFEGKHVIASHCNVHRFIQTERHLPDNAIERLAERNGVIGVVPFNKFLQREWSGRKHDVTLDDVVRMIDHICQVTGSANHVGIGSDFDGGFGAQATPREIDTSRDMHKIGDVLLERGYDPTHVAQIMHGNWLRVLSEALPG